MIESDNLKVDSAFGCHHLYEFLAVNFMILLTLMMYRFFFVIFSHIYYLNVCISQWSE